MKKLLIGMAIVLALTGCGKKEEAKQEAKDVFQNMNQRRETSQRLLEEAAQALSRNEVKKAIVSLEGAIEMNPTDERGYLMLSEIFLKLKSYDNAVKVLERATKVSPENPFVYYLLAEANDGLGRNVPALLNARNSVKLFQQKNDPQNMQKAVQLLETLVEKEKKARAAQS